MRALLVVAAANTRLAAPVRPDVRPNRFSAPAYGVRFDHREHTARDPGVRSVTRFGPDGRRTGRSLRLARSGFARRTVRWAAGHVMMTRGIWRRCLL